MAVDPLTIIAFTISALDISCRAAQGLVRLIDNFKHGPGEILSARNDVTDLILVLSIAGEDLREELEQGKGKNGMEYESTVPLFTEKDQLKAALAAQEVVNHAKTSIEKIRLYAENVIAQRKSFLGRMKPPDMEKLKHHCDELRNAKLNIILSFQLQSKYAALSRLSAVFGTD